MRRKSEDLAVLLGRKDFEVWNGDPEIVYEEKASYAELLQILSIISQGYFSPVEINEQWHRGSLDIIQLSFVLNGKGRNIYIPRKDEFLDFRFLFFVNSMLEQNDYHFCLRDDPADPLILFVSDVERYGIERSLKWKFVNFMVSELAKFFVASFDRRLQLKYYDELIRDINSALKTMPPDPQFFLFRGIALYRLGHKPAARADWDYAIKHGFPGVIQFVQKRLGKGAIQ